MILIFDNLVMIIAILSLFFWLLAELKFKCNSSLNIDWGGIHSVKGFYNLNFITQGNAKLLNFNIVRNTGIFSEAPMFSFVLTIAFILNLFYLKSTYLFKTRCAVLVLSIITTVSTTGYIVSLLALLGYEIFNHIEQIKKTSKFVKILILLCAVFIFIGIMINKLKSFGGSISIRNDDFKAGFKSFLNHPFFGNGYGNYKSIKQYMLTSRLGRNGNSGFSSGLMLVLSSGGIAYLFLYLLPFIYAIIKKRYVEIFLMILMFIIFSITIVNELPLFIFMIIFIISDSLFKGE